MTLSLRESRLPAVPLFLLAVTVTLPAAFAQSTGDLTLEELMNVVVVSATRREQSRFDSPRAVGVITAAEIRERNYRTVPEALMELPGVLVQETNYAGGAPILRGMVGNQILLVVDGIRLNNAITRLGPNQYLNTIDINQVERIELVFGPASVLHGSDALGGVIHVITKRPHLTPSGDPQVRGNFSSRAATVDRSLGARAGFDLSSSRLAVAGGVTWKQFGDLRAGGAIGRQFDTGYHERDGDVQMSLQLSPSQTLTAGLARVRQGDVPRTDAYLTGVDLQHQWNPQARDLAFVRYQVDTRRRWLRNVSLTLWSHQQFEEISRIARSAPATRIDTRDHVGTVGYSLEASTARGKRHLFTYGAEIYSDRVSSSRSDVNLVTGLVTPGKANYADRSRYSYQAFFLQDELAVTTKLDLVAGLRLTVSDTQATVSDRLAGTVVVDAHNAALAPSIYAFYKAGTRLRLIAGVAEGFRAPNVDDTTVLRSFTGGFEVPNDKLRPERARQYEAGLRYQGPRFNGSLFAYQGRYRDIIGRAPGMFEGLPFLDDNHNGIRDPRELSVFQRQNAGSARTHGFDARFQLRLARPLRAFGAFGWIRGYDEALRAPLRRVPPPAGNAGLRWKIRRRVWAESVTQFSGAQRRLAPADLTDLRIRPNGTDGFQLVHLRGGFDLGEHGTLTLSLHNLTNRAYRLHGSGFDAPGRGLVVGFYLR